MLLKKLTKGFLTTLTLAAGIANADVHTWHNIHVENGQWKVQLKMLNEKGQFYAADGKTTLAEMMLHDGETQKYGFEFARDDDFNVAYTVTVIHQGLSNSPDFTNKTCVFVVTAEGPAQPDIAASGFKGANCTWKRVPGVGEDFAVS